MKGGWGQAGKRLLEASKEELRKRSLPQTRQFFFFFLLEMEKSLQHMKRTIPPSNGVLDNTANRLHLKELMLLYPWSVSLSMFTLKSPSRTKSSDSKPSSSLIKDCQKLAGEDGGRYIHPMKTGERRRESSRRTSTICNLGESWEEDLQNIAVARRSSLT